MSIPYVFMVFVVNILMLSRAAKSLFSSSFL